MSSEDDSIEYSTFSREAASRSIRIINEYIKALNE